MGEEMIGAHDETTHGAEQSETSRQAAADCRGTKEMCDSPPCMGADARANPEEPPRLRN